MNQERRKLLLRFFYGFNGLLLVATSIFIGVFGWPMWHDSSFAFAFFIVVMLGLSFLGVALCARAIIGWKDEPVNRR